MLKAKHTVEDVDVINTKQFYSSNYSTSSVAPSLTITYDNDKTTYSKPFGWFDKVSSTAISGWVWSFDFPNDHLTFRANLSNTSTGDIYNLYDFENMPRPDVAEAGYEHGNYGFRFPMNWVLFPDGEYVVRVYVTGKDNNEYLVAQSPRYYKNTLYAQYLNTGEYYINNKGTGRYLKYEEAQPKANSGSLSTQSNLIKWNLVELDEGYLIVSKSNPNLCLSVPTSTSSSSTVWSTYSSTAPSANCVWLLGSSLEGNYLLKNKYSNRFLYVDENGNLVTSTDLGDITSTYFDAHIWRIIDTDLYGNNDSYTYQEARFGANQDNVILLENETYAFTIANSEKALWAEPSDYIIEPSVDNIVRVDSSNFSIKGVQAGNCSITVKHKVTGFSITVAVYVCKYEHTINCYFDNGYSTFRGQSAAACSEDINNYVDDVALQYAKIFQVKILRNNATLVTSALDICKSKNNKTIEDFCKCSDSPDHSLDANIYSYLSTIDPGDDEITSVFWTGHAFKANVNGDDFDQDRGSWLNNSILISRKTDLNYDALITGTLFHELCHEFSAYDHYHYTHALKTDGSGKCKNPGCIRCYGNTTSYKTTCVMKDSEQYIYNSVYNYEWLCSGCIDDISTNLQERNGY